MSRGVSICDWCQRVRFCEDGRCARCRDKVRWYLLIGVAACGVALLLLVGVVTVAILGT